MFFFCVGKTFVTSYAETDNDESVGTRRASRHGLVNLAMTYVSVPTWGEIGVCFWRGTSSRATVPENGTVRTRDLAICTSFGIGGGGESGILHNRPSRRWCW
jgi:hypothetical protein